MTCSAQVEDDSRRCGLCSRFNRVKAQQHFESNPGFLLVTQETMPRLLFGLKPGHPDYRVDWDELGACDLLEQIRTPNDTCPEWTDER